MKKFITLYILILFSSNIIAQTRFYVKEGNSLSNGATSCIVAYFNANKSHVFYMEHNVAQIQQNLTSNPNYYNQLGAQYVNGYHSNELLMRGVSIGKYYQNAHNGLVYVINFPDYVKDITTGQWSVMPFVAFSTDFTKARKLGDSNPPLYVEVSSSQFIKPLF